MSKPKVKFPDYIKWCENNLKDLSYNEHETAKYFIYKFMEDVRELNN